MKMLKLTLAALALSLVAFAQDAAKSTVVTREGVGEAAVVNPKDELKPFEEAKEKALRNAVEQAAGVRIDADTTVVNNQLVRDQVFASTTGYVKKFEVLEKGIVKGVMTVKVKADVITDNLDKDINAARDLVKRMGTPSIVVVVQEQTIPADGKAIVNSETLATALENSLKADGWLVKDRHAMNKSLALEGAATLGPTEIKKINDLTQARFVLYGKASIRNESTAAMPMVANGAPYFPVSGEYDLALVSTESAESLVKVAGALRMSNKTKELTVSYERVAFNVINERKDEIIAPVRKAILEHFRNQLVNGARLELSVGGLENFGAAKDFKKALESMKGMKEAVQDSFTGGKAVYRVTFLGSSQDLAEVVESSTFKKRKLEVVSVNGLALEVKVGK